MRHLIKHYLFTLSLAALLGSCSAGGASSVENSKISAEPSSNTEISSISSEPIPSESSSLEDSSSSVSTDSSSSESNVSTSSSSAASSSDFSSSAASSSSASLVLPQGGEGDNTAFTIVRASDSFVPNFDNGMYWIDEAGEYDLSGTLSGMIFINVPETDDDTGEVTLNLNGVDMSCSYNSVIYCLSADQLDISAKKGTTNVIRDGRAVETEDDETQGGGAIYSKVDTKLKGSGALSVTGTYNNGVHSTKDLEIQKLTLSVTAVNNAIKGNDSITVNSGNITAISSGGDALKTEDSDVSSKGSQRGDITILGGTLNLYSACDGVQAAHDFVLGTEGDAGEEPKVTIQTNKFSPYTNDSDIASTSTSTMYLKTTSNSFAYRYAVRFYNEAGEEGVWSNATYKTTQTSGGRGRTTYYIYELDRPSSYSSFAVYAFASSNTENSVASSVASSAGAAINSSYDTVSFTLNVGQKSISLGGWSNYSASQSGGPGGMPGGWNEGNKDKADVSAKGIKAQNDIHILSGTLNITAYDDGLHANYGEALDSGESSTGDINIKGGTTTISASDDGVHAERYLRISGGSITVTDSYEGLEGNQIYVSGGTAVAYAKDDAVNAGNGENSAGLRALIEVSGGHLFAAVPSSGDTDGIDSNGDYVQTGGEVIAAGVSGRGGAAALDTDGSVTVNSGTLIIFGSSEKTPSRGSGVTQSSKSGSYGNSAHVVTFANGTANVEKLPNYSYAVCNAYSSLGSISSIS